LAKVFSRLRAKNLKGFADTGELDLGELNIFVGPNSAGKSTLLQTLLLLKQTFDDPNPENRLITDGRLVELGGFRDVVYRHDPRASLFLDLALDPSLFETLPYPARGRELVPVGFSLEFGATQRVGRTYIKNFSFWRNGGNKLLWGSFSALGLLKQWESAVAFRKRDVHVSFYHFVPSIYLSGRSHALAPGTPVLSFLQALYSFRQLCEGIFGSMIHLQPIRTPIKSVYRVTGESPVSVGPTGENLLGILHRDERRRKQARRNLLNHLNNWLDRKFGLVKDVKLEQLTRTKTLYALSGLDSKTGTAVNLAAVGFGVSQVAPIIVQGFLSPPNTCILIEQPEIHLHPSAQAELGDLFIEFANQGKQLFVETHSQYVLFRILRRIAEKKLDRAKVRMFFVSRTEDGSRVGQLEVDEHGRITNWPPGFFEEGYEETAAMAEALVK